MASNNRDARGEVAQCSALSFPPPSTSISEVNFRGGNDRARRETGKDGGKEKRGKGERGIGKERREKVTKIRGQG